MIAFMSNINIEPIKAFYSGMNTYFCGYNQYALEILDDHSNLYSKDIKKAFLFIDGDEFVKDYIYEVPDEKSMNALKVMIAEHLGIIETYLQKRKDIAVILNTVVLNPRRFTTYLDANAEYGFNEIESMLNNSIKELALKYPNALILDWRRIVTAIGYDNLYAEKYWYFGRIKLNNTAFMELKKGIEGIVNTYEGKIKKVLTLDLDNTLWGGILGEDGMNGIRLSEDDAGKIYRDFQKAIKSLKNLGVLLTLNSKNNIDDVREVFDNHPMMILRSGDFIVKKINWNDKVQNMKEIAKELNLGLDSFVFIDDNPAERQLVHENLPEVVVPEFPKEVEFLKEWFINEVVYQYFPKINLLGEDRNKHKQYMANIQRNEHGNKLNVKEFIKGLGIQLSMYSNDVKMVQRISQLTQKTNQFNMTTKRYDESAINTFITDNTAQVFALEYDDKFGKEGAIGVSIVKIERNIGNIDVFLVSCRVIGREVEYCFLSKVLEFLKKGGINKITADFLETNKNKGFRNFYSTAGLIEVTPGRFEGSIDSIQKVLEERISEAGFVVYG